LRFENPTREKAFQRLLLSGLLSRYPKVREYTGQQLYGTLQVSDIIPDEQLDDIFEILANTTWIEKADVLKPVVDNLFQLLNVQKPIAVQKTSDTSQQQL
jgi:hypothetical protein